MITDGDWTFNTDKMIEYAKKTERTSYERDMLNQFIRHAYYMYCRIRDCVNPKKCKRLSLSTVRERLQDENSLIFTTDLLKISSEEVFFILDFAEKYLEVVR